MAALYVGCVSGALAQAEYLALIAAAGFTGTRIAKSTPIDLPEEVLAAYFSAERIAELRDSGLALVQRDGAGHQAGLIAVRPEVLAAAPEFQPTNWTCFNAGVMVINVERLRADHARFERYLREHLAARTYGFHDQIAYNDFYRRRWSRRPVEMNWKPYWGWNPAAQIVHFHGPKLGAIGAILDGRWDWTSNHGRQIGSLFASHVADYEAWLRLCLDAAPGVPAEDQDRIARALRHFPAYRDRAATEPIDLSFATQSMLPDDDAAPAMP